MTSDIVYGRKFRGRKRRSTFRRIYLDVSSGSAQTRNMEVGIEFAAFTSATLYFLPSFSLCRFLPIYTHTSIFALYMKMFVYMWINSWSFEAIILFPFRHTRCHSYPFSSYIFFIIKITMHEFSFIYIYLFVHLFIYLFMIKIYETGGNKNY